MRVSCHLHSSPRDHTHQETDEYQPNILFYSEIRHAYQFQLFIKYTNFREDREKQSFRNATRVLIFDTQTSKRAHAIRF